MNGSGDPPQTGAKLEPRHFGPFAAADLARYAAASGDDNPLHLDPDIARRAGLDRPPVQGMLMMSCFEPALAAWLPDFAVVRLSAKFLRPVLAGEGIAISGRVAQSTGGENPRLVLRLMAHRTAGDLAVLAEAALVPRASAREG